MFTVFIEDIRLLSAIKPDAVDQLPIQPIEGAAQVLKFRVEDGFGDHLELAHAVVC